MFSAMIPYIEPHIEWTLPSDLAELGREQGSELLRGLFADFREDTTARLEVLCEALTGGNLTRARSEAHAIKGSAIQVGATRLVRLCRWIEQTATAGDMDATATAFEEAQLEFARVVHSMSTTDLRKALAAAQGPQ